MEHWRILYLLSLPLLVKCLVINKFTLEYYCSLELEVQSLMLSSALHSLMDNTPILPKIFAGRRCIIRVPEPLPGLILDQYVDTFWNDPSAHPIMFTTRILYENEAILERVESRLSEYRPAIFEFDTKLRSNSPYFYLYLNSAEILETHPEKLGNSMIDLIRMRLLRNFHELTNERIFSNIKRLSPNLPLLEFELRRHCLASSSCRKRIWCHNYFRKLIATITANNPGRHAYWEAALLLFTLNHLDPKSRPATREALGNLAVQYFLDHQLKHIAPCQIIYIITTLHRHRITFSANRLPATTLEEIDYRCSGLLHSLWGTPEHYIQRYRWFNSMNIIFVYPQEIPDLDTLNSVAGGALLCPGLYLSKGKYLGQEVKIGDELCTEASCFVDAINKLWLENIPLVETDDGYDLDVTKFNDQNPILFALILALNLSHSASFGLRYSKSLIISIYHYKEFGGILAPVGCLLDQIHLLEAFPARLFVDEDELSAALRAYRCRYYLSFIVKLCVSIFSVTSTLVKHGIAPL